MVKYGKLYREIQIKEFQGNYIDYKRLKQKIRAMKQLLPRTSQEIITKRNSNTSSIKLNLRSSLSDYEESRNVTISSEDDKYGAELKVFKELLDQEFRKCYKFFKKMKKQLHNKINKNLLASTNYSKYNIQEILKEVGELRKTIYLAKCLNAFINDNMMAIKKILKKFDKNFYNYFGNFGPKYILDNLCMKNSELEYLLQFKIIDETSCIIESNAILLKEYFLEEISQNNVVEKNNFERSYNDIFEFLKDIDELIYFKIQYKEWFYFRKKDALITTKSELYKNIMYNPILFSAYHKDDLMNKFLSRKEEIKEVEEVQLPLSIRNKINIVLIFIHSFFYNTLISGIYPILFLFLEKKNEIEKEHKKDEGGKAETQTRFSLLIISSTYISSYFSILIYHCFGSKKIKIVYIISYFLFLVGSLLYILGCQLENNDINSIIGLLIGSRILIGLGSNPTMGKKYILSYSSKYFLPFISKIYVLISILGHSFGPLITFILFNPEEADPNKNQNQENDLLSYFYYSGYNCIGWYGFIISILLLFINIFLFTSPNSQSFSKLKTEKKLSKKGTDQRETAFLIDDLDDAEDKDIYKLQKEMKNKTLDIIEEDLESNKSKNSIPKINSLNNRKFSFLKEKDNDEELSLEKANTLEKKNIESDINVNIIKSQYEVNPILFNNNDDNENNENELEKENGNFVNINMIPRTIEDLIRKEKKTFSYLNTNLLIILIILFFCNLLKENSIAYCSYYVHKHYEVHSYNNIFAPKYLCFLISCSYLLEIFSMFFILPFYKINTLIKKLLVILMASNIVLMIPLSFEINVLAYFIIISFLILLSSIIEVLASCYLAYLTPPKWKFSHMNAGALPLYIMTFGKLIGCIICLSAFSEDDLLNNRVIIAITFISYGFCVYNILKSQNFRIKAIARIMRKSELETNEF